MPFVYLSKLTSEVCILVHYIEFGIITTQRRDFLKQCCIPLIWLTIWLGLDCLNNLNIICRVSICIHIYIHNVQLMNTNLTWFVSSYHEWNMEGNYFLWYDEPYENPPFTSVLSHVLVVTKTFITLFIDCMGFAMFGQLGTTNSRKLLPIKPLPCCAYWIWRYYPVRFTGIGSLTATNILPYYTEFLIFNS